MLRIPTILTADELIEKAFKKASKVDVIAKSRNEMIKQKNMAKINSVSDSISTVLEGYVKAFPDLRNLPPFYRDLIDLLLDIDKLKKSLGALDWCAYQVKVISKNARTRIKRTKNPKETDEIRDEMYGRSASLVKQIKKELAFLNGARDKIKQLPTINPEMRTIVVAGAPNVGKSLLVAEMSTGKPKVASYPFTTKDITIGIFSIGRKKYQMIDTPGLLDRPLEDRNEIELQAIIALRSLSDLVVFILDPTGSCGYPLDYQQSLLDGIKKLYPKIKILTIENKADIAEGPSKNLRVSALTKQGLDELRKKIEQELPPETESQPF